MLLALLLYAALGPPYSFRFILLAVALTLGLNHRISHFLTLGRPMVTATFLGVLAIALFYIGIRSGRHLYFGFGLLALLAAFLFKQTAAMFAAIPAVALLTNRQLSFRTRFIYAGLPPVVPVAVTGIIHFWFPEVDRYFLWLPRQYNVYPEAAIGFLFGLIATTPLYCFALAEWCLTTSDAKETDDRARWLIAAAIVTVPASCFSLAKVGGWDNSLFPALVALTAFALWRFPRYQSYLGNDSLATERRFAFSSALGLMMIATVLMPSNEFLRGHNPYSILRQHPDLLGPLVKLRRPEHPLVEQEYQPVIEYVRDLPGRVVCPKDPTIPMYANGYLGRQLQSELDAVPKDGGYAKVLPDYTLREIQDARFLVHVRRSYPHDQTLSTAQIRNLGFEPLPAPFQAYLIFQRVRTPGD
jgi:hypothetical protein